MPQLASVLLGLLLLLGGTIGCFMLAGNRPADLFIFPSGLAMFLLPIGCSILSFGIRGPLVVLRSLATAIWSRERTQMPEAARVISAVIGYVYGAGGFVFCASMVTFTKSFPGIAASGLTESVGAKVAATIVSLIYTVVCAELVLRPLKHRVV
jgi:ABC-type transporter Mla maintaining outer membrane lipid asymmetry permease subunit MlaE